MSTSIEGRIAVDVSFADKAIVDGVQSLKKITLADTQAYTTGKVAIVTGTCGTAISFLSWTQPPYTNSSGEPVTLNNLRCVAFSAVPYARASVGFVRVATSRDGQASVMSLVDSDISTNELGVSCTAGTASYTLVLYGT